ncbi:hypothetical protein NA57DRAFT_69152 [Rhizodiscina lignyota]|uniref:WW domain-containing protein n=1 Tax=Rhizodiscina lignyota TaxID=1504668 RepID=A0A9P4I7W5_9PEZI|nr:hypothetical protein NA57DRAFT_69152 [Rhizodiscina lignyota]
MDAPPSYTNATSPGRSTLGVPAPDVRRSMEDEQRPLPAGWVRSFDPETKHQFFVDTTCKPPRSIWHHPFDDEEYMSSLAPKRRSGHGSAPPEKSHDMSRDMKSHHAYDDSSDDEELYSNSRGMGPVPADLPQRPASNNSNGVKQFGKKFKNNLKANFGGYSSTTEMEMAEQERDAYAQHVASRQAMSRAVETGEPQYMRHDQGGRAVYMEPPTTVRGNFYPPNAVGYSPYDAGVYARPDPAFLRPRYAYARPIGVGLRPYRRGVVGRGLLTGALIGAALD